MPSRPIVVLVLVLVLLLVSSLALAPSHCWAQAAPAPAPPASQQTAARPISLRETVAMTLKQNRVIQSADADVEVAAGNELAAEGVLDFEIDGQANYTRSRSSIIPDSQFQTLASDGVHTAVSFNQSLSYGGRFGLQLANDYTRATTRLRFTDRETGMTTDQIETSDTWVPTVQLTYFQPLLKGFGEKAFLGQRNVAAVNLDAASADLMNVAAGVVRDAVQAYWELVYQQREVEIRRSSLSLAREQLRVTQARLDVGVGAPTDLAEVRQTIATREEDLLLSQLTLSERALDIRQITGLKISPTDIALVATEEATPQLSEVALEKALAMANDKNLQIAAARLRGKAARLTVEVNENGLLPQLDLTASVGPQGTATDLGTAAEQLVQFDNYSINVGLNLVAPVQRRNAKGLVAVARGQLHKAEITEEDLRAQVAVAVARAVDLVKSTQQRLATDAEAIQLGQVNLDAERARFDVGRSTNFDVLRRQDELSQAQLRRIRASADYMKAVSALQTLTGEIVTQYGIQVKRHQ
jgi:outer membrane protein TolC